MQIVFSIPGVFETEQVAALLAKHVTRGDVVALNGPLGAGKTVFARAFIRALNPRITDVPSPTFTLLQTYETPAFPVYHFDMYRLKSPDEAYEIGIEDAFAEGVSLIEWAEKIAPLLPRQRYDLTFTGPDNKRTLILKGPESDESGIWEMPADLTRNPDDSIATQAATLAHIKQHVCNIGGILPATEEDTSLQPTCPQKSHKKSLKKNKTKG